MYNASGLSASIKQIKQGINFSFATKSLFELSGSNMKRFVLPFIMALTLVSCSKSHIAGPEQIEGNWELREMANGLAGTIKYGPGNGVIMRFSSNKAYQFSIPSIPDRTGSYAITPAKNPGDYKLIIQYFSNGNAMQENDSIRFVNNQLIFLSAETCCDIPIVYYGRIP